MKARVSWVALRFDDGVGVVFLIVPKFGFEVLGDIRCDNRSEFGGIVVAAEDGR